MPNKCNLLLTIQGGDTRSMCLKKMNESPAYTCTS